MKRFDPFCLLRRDKSRGSISNAGKNGSNLIYQPNGYESENNTVS